MPKQRAVGLSRKNPREYGSSFSAASALIRLGEFGGCGFGTSGEAGSATPGRNGHAGARPAGRRPSAPLAEQLPRASVPPSELHVRKANSWQREMVLKQSKGLPTKRFPSKQLCALRKALPFQGSCKLGLARCGGWEWDKRTFLRMWPHCGDVHAKHMRGACHARHAKPKFGASGHTQKAAIPRVPLAAAGPAEIPSGKPRKPQICGKKSSIYCQADQKLRLRPRPRWLAATWIDSPCDSRAGCLILACLESAGVTSTPS